LLSGLVGSDLFIRDRPRWAGATASGDAHPSIVCRGQIVEGEGLDGVGLKRLRREANERFDDVRVELRPR
jgi:hypothetical protein